MSLGPTSSNGGSSLACGLPGSCLLGLLYSDVGVLTCSSFSLLLGGACRSLDEPGSKCFSAPLDRLSCSDKLVLRHNFATLVTDRVLARTWRESKGYEHKYLQMDPVVAGDATEPQDSELSDMDVLDDGEDSDPPNETEFDGPQR